MKLTCEHCGELFTPDQDTQHLWEDGYIERLELCCDACFEFESSQELCYE